MGPGDSHNGATQSAHTQLGPQHRGNHGKENQDSHPQQLTEVYTHPSPSLLVPAPPNQITQKKKDQSNKVFFNIPDCLKSILIKFQFEAGACSNKWDQYEAFIQISHLLKNKTQKILTLYKNTGTMRKPDFFLNKLL